MPTKQLMIVDIETDGFKLMLVETSIKYRIKACIVWKGKVMCMEELENLYHVFPFVWLHGAEEKKLRCLMEKIYESGIRAVCLESRPHPDFLGEGWWRDLDIILEEAWQRAMKVWILDDAHFPTGEAGGAVKNAPDRLKRWSLVEYVYDVSGPAEKIRFNVMHNRNIHPATGEVDEAYCRERLQAVVAGRLDEDGKLYEVFDVTEKVRHGWLHLNLAEGAYRIFVFTQKLHMGKLLADGISLLEPESVRILIDTVYEAHYKRYRNYFGTVLAGFFSDEPGFFNLSDRGYGFAGKTGEEKVPLPWTDEVFRQLQAKLGYKDAGFLPYLYGESGIHGEEKEVRRAYMNLVTEKYSRNFTDQLADWCKAHGVEYTGHVVEDYPSYDRLGQGVGHYFRAVRGQAMAGIDIVLQNLLPENESLRKGFFQYGLPQLAASCACQNHGQRGRALCEVFGAYGWAESVTDMKWQADFMLVGGINRFVPHAFTDSAFPDPDCPPHFWAEGNNPQYPYMKYLFTYMNRMAELLQGGKPQVENLILFEAESDWVGEAESYFLPGKELLVRQIPYHVVDMDSLKGAEIREGRICVGDMSYKRLLVPQMQYMHGEEAGVLERLMEDGGDIYFHRAYPADYHGGSWKELKKVPLVSTEEWVRQAEKGAIATVEPLEGQGLKWLRMYPYQGQEGMTVFLFNSSGHDGIRFKVCFREDMGEWKRCDVMDGREYAVEMEGSGGIGKICCELEPGETVLFRQTKQEKLPVLDAFSTGSTYHGKYRISMRHYQETEWKQYGEEADLTDFSEEYPEFAGNIRYEFRVPASCRAIRLKGAWDGITLYCDGDYLGGKIAEPYFWELSGGRQEKCIRIELATTLVGAVPDEISCRLPLRPVGFLGKVLMYE